jgi:hypothetical protein
VDPRETHNFAGNPAYADRLNRLRGRLIDRFIEDGYDEPLDSGQWRQYPSSHVPADQDVDLLYQDPRGLSDIMAEFLAD